MFLNIRLYASEACYITSFIQFATAKSEKVMPDLDPFLLEILVCPVTKGALSYDAEKQELISKSAGLAYPVRDGIPVMLPEEARKLN